MSAYRVTKCQLCGGHDLGLVLDLGSSPPTCAMPFVGSRAPVEEFHPLELLRCGECSLVQLSVVVDPAIVFGENYPYSSGNSKALHDNFTELAGLAMSLVHGVVESDVIVDIGANDGTLLEKFPVGRRVAVEPTDQVHKIDATSYQKFFSEKVAAEIVEKHGRARIVTACNVLAHVDDVHDVMRGIKRLLADDGVFIAENHDLASVVDGGQWDTVYHEHLRYYSPQSFARLLDIHGLHPEMWTSIPTHGGSFRTVAVHGSGEAVSNPSYDFKKLAQDAAAVRRGVREVAGPGVWGVGATARATTVINYCGLDVEDVQAVCEVPGSDKIGHVVPGTRIPVVSEELLFEADQPSAVILFSWYLADYIVPKLRERGFKGEVFLPLPYRQGALSLEAA